jgi:hypothetical protein
MKYLLEVTRIGTKQTLSDVDFLNKIYYHSSETHLCASITSKIF